MVQYMRASGNRAARMVRADKFMKMETSMLVNTMMVRDQAVVVCMWLQSRRSTMENGVTIDDKVKVLSLIQVV